MARDFDSLVAVLHADVLDAPSGMTPRQISEDLGFHRYTTFMNQLEQQNGFKLDANMVYPLMRRTGSVRGIHYLADRMEGVFIPRPKALPGMEPLSQQAIRSVKEVSDVMEAFLKAVGDGSINASDKQYVRKEIYEAITALVAFGEAVELA